MTKYPVPEEKKGYGLKINISRNEKVMLLWIAVCLWAGGLITSVS
jgi:hypothetical protein